MPAPHLETQASFETSGCYEGERCLKVTEAEVLSGSPQVYLAYVPDLVPGDMVTASFWGKGEGEGLYEGSMTRIWGHYTINDHTDYSNPGGGPNDYVGLDGIWGKSEYTWTVPDGETGLVIEARVYAYDVNYRSILVDNLVVNVTSATGIAARRARKAAQSRGCRG